MSATYDRYITSDAWEARKLAYYATHERPCHGCSTTKDVDLLHHTYDRLGAEHDDDLVPVCESCHMLIHRLHEQRGGSLSAVTFEALRFLADDRSARPEAESRRLVRRNQRGAVRDNQGRLVSSADWRESAMRNVRFRRRGSGSLRQHSRSPCESVGMSQ
ncbi:hypothetical protein Rruber_00238 [Rhodococcus ruber]